MMKLSHTVLSLPCHPHLHMYNASDKITLKKHHLSPINKILEFLYWLRLSSFCTLAGQHNLTVKNSYYPVLRVYQEGTEGKKAQFHYC